MLKATTKKIDGGNLIDTELNGDMPDMLFEFASLFIDLIECGMEAAPEATRESVRNDILYACSIAYEGGIT